MKEIRKCFGRRVLAALLVLLMAVPVASFAAENVIEIADTSPALRVYNGYTSGNVVIVIATGGASATMTNTVDSQDNVLDGSGATYDTITEIASFYGAMTNSSGVASVTVDKDCSLDADSTDGELLDGTYTATPGTWLEIPWDTSDVAFFSVYKPISTYERGVYVSKITGVPGGTHNATVSAYVAQTLVYQTGVASNTAGSVFIDLDTNIPCTRGRGVFVRAARTTATTGSIGMTLSP